MKSLKIAVVAAGVFAATAVHAQALVKIDGSSTVFPVTEAVAEDFQKAKKGAVRVTVGVSGTGGGCKKFCRGETDIYNGWRPILREGAEEATQKMFTLLMAKGEAAGRRSWMEEKGNEVEADV